MVIHGLGANVFFNLAIWRLARNKNYPAPGAPLNNSNILLLCPFEQCTKKWLSLPQHYNLLSYANGSIELRTQSCNTRIRSQSTIQTSSPMRGLQIWRTGVLNASLFGKLLCTWWPGQESVHHLGLEPRGFPKWLLLIEHVVIALLWIIAVLG